MSFRTVGADATERNVAETEALDETSQLVQTHRRGRESMLASVILGIDSATSHVFYWRFQVAVLIAKYLLTNGGFLRLAYHMRKSPLSNCITDWLVT